MNDEFDSLISGYLDETLGEQQLVELERCINAEPGHARRFADAVYLEQRLTAELKLKRFTESNVAEPKETAMPTASVTVMLTARQRIWMIAALAACLLVAAGLAFWRPANSAITHQDSFASIVRTLEANWATGHELSVGQRISSQLLRLEAGIVHLAFDSGVEITLQGPAVFELKSVDQTRLHSGVLTCTVPTGAEGFRVDTPTAQVVDLGTAFGIDQREDGQSEVSVFDGEVEIIIEKARDKHLLTEGKTIQLGADGSVIEVAFSTAPFEKLWPTASGIAGSTGDFRFAPQWPRRLRLIQSDTEIFVVPEGYAKVLDASCPINISQSDWVDSSIPVGQRVRSFLLQFNPAATEAIPSGEKVKRIEGSITFERPVIGLIIKSETLEKTDETFSRRSGRVPPFKRGLELSPPRLADVVSISEDRRTVTLKLVVFERLSDHVRVIVDAALGDVENEK